eukprot:gb/GEZN01015516.1/.p1 GENE.gb/GEZN01015516.1/~~gb/GEZN01015516.1/.p1  ORF type:complete len:151 (+),score=3.05 gb/GEZN01015516.1/:117-569(+)
MRELRRERRHGRPVDSVLAFKPTGWTGSKPRSRHCILPLQSADGPVPKNKAQTKRTKGTISSTKLPTISIAIHYVPYSEHSTFTELRRFVALLARWPGGLRYIVPTVMPGKAQQIQSHFADLMALPESTQMPVSRLPATLNTAPTGTDVG